jgi:ribosomal protein S21
MPGSNLIFVPRDSTDLDLAKKFTRACLKVGLLREIKPRRYVKPSMKRRLKSKVARAKLAKTARRDAAGEAARLQRLGVKQ